MITWTKYSHIKELPTGIWSHVANDNVCLSESFMDAIEKTNVSDSFFYYIVYYNKEIAGVAFAYKSNIAICRFVPIKMKIIMTGTYQTYGRHYWYNPTYFDEDTFMCFLFSILRKEKSSIIIVRDFMGTNVDVCIQKLFSKLGFIKITPYSSSFIYVSQSCSSIWDYLMCVKKKHRNTYKKILNQRVSLGITVEYSRQFDVNELYDLYKNVSERATEYTTALLPRDFFEILNNTMHENMMIIKLCKEEKVIGFVLIFEDSNIITPYLMGINYSYKDCNVWHNLALESISYAINQNKRILDLGLTSFEIKKRLGASKVRINMFVRFKNVVLNKLFGDKLKNII